MDERSSKIYSGLCLLVLVWIGVYWAWEPSTSSNPKISISTPQPTQPTQQPASTTNSQPSTHHHIPDQSPQIDPPNSTQPIDDPAPQPTLIPPTFKSHTVQRNETMGSIAKIYYGKELGSVISQANPRVDPLKLRVGMTLRIPTDPNNIQGMVANQPTTPGVIPQTTQPSPVVEYMIQSGDSLSKIASRFYGSARYEDFIYDNNKDILKSKDAIGIGQVLKLPPLPESSNTDE